MKLFNKNHSSERICSEHGIGKLKQWGFMRGRNDFPLCSSNTKFITIQLRLLFAIMM